MRRLVAALALAALLASPGAAARKTKKKPAPKGPARIDAAAVNRPVQSRLGPGSAGAAVVRAQILLDRAHFSPGEIDGRWGDNLTVAVKGYQAARKLDVSGVVDAATWQQLDADTAPLLVPYTITAAEVKGPFRPVPDDIMKKAALPALGFESPAEALAEKFHISPALLSRLNPKRDLAKPGEEIQVPNVVREGTSSADRVVVLKEDRTVTAWSGDTILAQYPSTIGSEHDPLPIGDWLVTVVQENPVFNYNPDLFWDSGNDHTKATIKPGPNNPVGVVWIGLTKEHYGIHGTPEPSKIGHTESHGCIRLTNWDALELARMVKKGTPVLLRSSAEAPPPAAAPAPAQGAVLPMALPIQGLKAADIRDTFDEGREGGKHEATDIMQPRGTPVQAVVNGAIVKLFTSKPGGLTVYQFDQAERYCYYYAHLDRYAEGLREKQRVRQGDVIGYVGSTGNAAPDAPHLHFAIFELGPEKQWWKGRPINPYPSLIRLAGR